MPEDIVQDRRANDAGRREVDEMKPKQKIMAAAREVYATNKLVKFCTNGTAILGFLVLLWQGSAWAVNAVDDYFAKAADVRALQRGQQEAIVEQKEQRMILERQTRQLDFIYYDTMKREKSNMDREIFELRSRTRTGAEEARLQQLIEDLRDIKERIRQQEAVVRGHR